MRCWNCLQEMPDTAQRCPHCEASVEEGPSAEEIEAARETLGTLLSAMPAAAFDELQQALAESETAEEFADRIFVGDCPQCGSSKTGNCEHDPEIGELLIGRCFDCGQHWCTLCEEPLAKGEIECPCWEDEDWGEDFDPLAE